MAKTHSALFPTQLALARWRYGGDTPHVFACTRTLSRAAWYDQAQQQFQAWIDAGGFHQPEPEHTDCTIPDTSAAPALTAAQNADAAARNPAWFDVTRCRLAQDDDCTN